MCYYVPAKKIWSRTFGLILHLCSYFRCVLWDLIYFKTVYSTFLLGIYLDNLKFRSVQDKNTSMNVQVSGCELILHICKCCYQTWSTCILCNLSVFVSKYILCMYIYICIFALKKKLGKRQKKRGFSKYLFTSNIYLVPWWVIGLDESLRDLKCSVTILRSLIRTPVRVKLRMCSPSKSDLNLLVEYLPVH